MATTLCDVAHRHWANAPVIHAASHFDHKKRVAWVPLFMHTCSSFFYNYGALLGGPLGHRRSAIKCLFSCSKTFIHSLCSIVSNILYVICYTLYLLYKIGNRKKQHKTINQSITYCLNFHHNLISCNVAVSKELKP